MHSKINLIVYLYKMHCLNERTLVDILLTTINVLNSSLKLLNFIVATTSMAKSLSKTTKLC